MDSSSDEESDSSTSSSGSLNIKPPTLTDSESEWNEGGPKGRDGGSDDSTETSSGVTESSSEEEGSEEEVGGDYVHDDELDVRDGRGKDEGKHGGGARRPEGKAKLSKTPRAPVPPTAKKPKSRKSTQKSKNPGKLSSTSKLEPRNQQNRSSSLDSPARVRTKGIPDDNDGQSQDGQAGDKCTTDKIKTKRKGRRSPFTEEQRSYIEDTYGKDWIDLVKKYSSRKHLSKLTVYKAEKADEILRSKLFAGKLGSEKSMKEWRQASDK